MKQFKALSRPLFLSLLLVPDVTSFTINKRASRDATSSIELRNTFASASLDRTIKVWGLGSHSPHYTLEGHERGVNCVDYYPSGDKPYILSGADDRTVKIWDYQVRTMLCHFS